jgi:hypothetical protein
MTETTSLSLENMQVLNLIQAMLGAITQAFRAVAIGIRNDKIEITFVLFQEDQDARDEIEDIVFRFDSLQVESKPIVLRVELISESQPLETASIWGRLVFLRKSDTN